MVFSMFLCYWVISGRFYKWDGLVMIWGFVLFNDRVYDNGWRGVYGIRVYKWVILWGGDF